MIHLFLNFNSCTVEFSRCVSSFIPRLTGYVNTYPGWDLSLSRLVKGAPGVQHRRCQSISGTCCNAKYQEFYIIQLLMAFTGRYWLRLGHGGIIIPSSLCDVISHIPWPPPRRLIIHIKLRVNFLFHVTIHILMSGQGKPFCFAGPLWGELSGHWWISLIKGQLYGYFLWCHPGQTAEREAGVLRCLVTLSMQCYDKSVLLRPLCLSRLLML